jgi:DNA-binding Lrp family transcriptional regulator
MDMIDKKILTELQKDATQNSSKLARKLNIPISTVHHRIKKLISDKTIEKIQAKLSPERVGKPILAFIFVTFDYRNTTSKVLSQRDSAEIIGRFSEVQEIHVISGAFDMLVKVRGKTNDEISSFVIDKLRTVRGVDKATTMFVMATEKEDFSIQL